MERNIVLKIIDLITGKEEEFRFYTEQAAQQVAEELKRREGVKTIIMEA